METFLGQGDGFDFEVAQTEAVTDDQPLRFDQREEFVVFISLAVHRREAINAPVLVAGKASGALIMVDHLQ